MTFCKLNNTLQKVILSIIAIKTAFLDAIGANSDTDSGSTDAFYYDRLQGAAMPKMTREKHFRIREREAGLT